MLTDAEIITITERVWANNPNPTRSLLMKACSTSHQRLDRLHKAGLIKYPPKIAKNMCHLFNKSDKWRNFKLRGSPTHGRTEPTLLKA
jgi:hypothetical protein